MNKRLPAYVLSLLLCVFTVQLPAERDEMSTYPAVTDELYRHCPSDGDGAFTPIGTSMLGWGVALAIGIAILSAALHQSKATTTTTTTK